MSKENNIDALREMLFETLRGIIDGSVDSEKANAVNATASRIIHTAKVEVDHMRVTQIVSPSQFITPLQVTATGTRTDTPLSEGVVKITHRLRGSA